MISLRKKIVARLFFDTKTLFAGLVLVKCCRDQATCKMLRLCFGNFVLDFEFSSFLLLFYGCHFHSSSSDANDNRVGNVLGRFPFRSANNSNCYNMRNICTKTHPWHSWMTNMSSIVSRMYMKRFSKLLRTQYRMFQRL